MISILILTDDVVGWINKIHCCLHTFRERKTSDGYHLENPLFIVDIESDTGERRKRRRYSHIIIDTPMSSDYEKSVIRPLVSNPLIYTNRYLQNLSTDISE